MDFRKTYEYWLNNDYFDEITRKELKEIKNNDEEIEDRFYKELEFGTAGLRGKIGAGTNRMNIYMVSKATEGLARYILDQGSDYICRGVVISYDIRHYSREFAERAAGILASNGIKAYLFDDIRPTPELSFAVRYLNAAAGIMVTASHNPKDYNGYKVYWEDGAQILSEIADGIVDRIKQIEELSTIKFMSVNEAVNKGLIQIIGKKIDDEYIEKVKGLALCDDIDKDIKIVYTPLNGNGNKPVRRVLRERGFNNIIVVPEQENPDPNFTTVGYPNPEDVKAFKYAEDLARKVEAELIIATDPDSDRLAIMVKEKDGSYKAFNGNQTGAILVEYILGRMYEKGILPSNGAIVKSIVTGDLGKAIAEGYGIKTEETLTGFKNICGKIADFEKEKSYEFIFGYEESIGYVAGTFVRDKDGVSSSMLLCEAAAYYKRRDRSLIDVLNSLYAKLGFYREEQVSIVLEGIEGQKRIKKMMENYRVNYPKNIDGSNLVYYIDYLKGVKLIAGNEEAVSIPKSDVLRFFLEDGSWYALRPSGTEPKIKLYIYSKASNEEESIEKVQRIKSKVLDILNSV